MKIRLKSPANYLAVLVAILLLMGSCVPNRKYVFLQKKDINQKTVVADTVLRSYDQRSFEYKIKPHDILSVKFESLTSKEYDFLSDAAQGSSQPMMANINPLLIGELVDDEGMIILPVLGKTKVAGLTVFQVQDTLQKLADEYLETPVVKVRLINFRITILGEVNSEGTITLANNQVNLMEAIGLAGGLTDLADKSKIKLIRFQDGKSKVQYINLLDENFLNSPNFFVNQNDILIVPALRQRPYRKYFGQNISVVLSALTLLVLTINLTKN